jgi:hypothetical protein
MKLLRNLAKNSISCNSEGKLFGKQYGFVEKCYFRDIDDHIPAD